MPSISKIRFTNVVYEGGAKRYNDDIFLFDSHNGAILLENGGGKTVFIQTAIQAILPNVELAERKMKDTLSLESSSAHIAIEWIINERPRRYGLTAVTLYMAKEGVKSYRYTYEYEEGSKHRIEELPFVRTNVGGKVRPASRDEMNDYYTIMKSSHPLKAHTFDTVKSYHQYLEDRFKIIASEWKKITVINSSEGGVESFFDGCKTTSQLVDQLLIPTVEEAIVGKGSVDFVQTFEKQREHFKAHKRLRRVIEENKQVEKQIESYISSFKLLDQEEKQLEEQKVNAKALYVLTKQEQEETKTTLTKIQTSLEDWQAEKDECERKEKSYAISLLGQKRDEAFEKYKDVQDDFDKLVQDKKEKENRLAQLRVSKVNEEIRKNEELRNHFLVQLSLLDRNEETIDLEEQFADNTAFLKGYFLHEEEKIQGNIMQVKIQKDRKQEEVDREKEVFNILVEDLNKRLLKETELDSKKMFLENTIAEIAKDILSNPQKERVEDEFPKWESNFQRHEQAIVSYENHLKGLEQSKHELKAAIPNIQIEYEKFQDEAITYKQQIKVIGDQQNEILTELVVPMPQWQHYYSIYEKEETIIGQLEEKVEKLSREREELLYKERQATRFADDYENNTSFTADPKLELWKNRWRNQFAYLEIGTDFVQQAARSLEGSVEEYHNNYPYWAITFIVTEAEVMKLRDKLLSVEMEMSHPVNICTEEEARTLIRGQGKASVKHIFPRIWKENLPIENFNNWKIEVQKLANESKVDRTKKELEHQRWSVALSKVRDFVQKYPFEQYSYLKEQFKLASEEEAKQKRVLHELTMQIDIIDNEMKVYHNRLSETTSLYNGLMTMLDNGRKYFAKKKDCEFHTKELIRIREEIDAENRKLEKTKKLLTNLKGMLDELDGQLTLATVPLYDLRGDTYYKEVVVEQPKYSSKSLDLLVSERKSLQSKLEDKQQGRVNLEDKLDTVKKKLKDLNDEMNLLEQQYGIVEAIEFPAHGNEEIPRLSKITRNLVVRIDAFRPTVDGLREKWTKASNEFDFRKGDFDKVYQEVVIFKKSLIEVKDQLDIERKRLQERYQFLTNERNRYKSLETEIGNAMIELEKQDMRFAFLHENVREHLLEDQIKQDYAYKRMDIISQLVKSISSVQEKVTSLEKSKNGEKTQFIKFCHDNILDIKLRNTCITGIEHKITYDDVFEWQDRMSGRIHRTVKIAEEDMREHDKQLQQFISHLHLYLRTIADELRLIPRQTRVKVEDKTKDIYIFSVPDWDEQEGKEALRHHIDWMVFQLDKDEYKDYEGKEDDSLIRKQIEKWLHTKQLLKNVMKEKDITVKCRKVSNDGKVSGVLTSWEKSNAWSGGEKWSKNMTLFLGILNYLAEKRVPLQGNQKRHRTVIVDNPFGKASSDHVLDPVFFIAEQLGFQIIALTAHAEGKFIRKYFPVIYSCRLRESASGETQIMTKNKEIRTAFFKDNDPEAMSRLGEQEQLAMF
jgi:chromosome segregation ATPase